MNIGMSLACFYPMTPEQSVTEAKKLNIDICEIFLNTFSEMEESYISRLKNICDANRLRVHSIHPFTSAMENYLFFSPYSRRIEDAVKFYRRYAEIAKFFGASVVNIHGDRGMGLESLENYVNCLEPLRRLQDETGVCFALENVFFSSVAHPEFVERLRQCVPDIRFTFDIKQAVKGGQDPYMLAQAMGDSIVNFHINDCDPEHICLLPGQGSIDFDRIASILKNSYSGPALIEVYRKNFQGIEDIAESKNFLESKFMLAK